MFEPSNQDLDCPECGRREVYFDREIGFYCMFCGRQFSSDEAELLVECENVHAQNPDHSS
jgi:DNA-directed RNA polymerase subunit RPC12/RpoP